MFAKQVKGIAAMEAGRGGQGTAVVVTFPTRPLHRVMPIVVGLR